MKKKALVASILTIALCLSLIAGSTFALFTSESTVNIAVSSGTVKVTAGFGETTGMLSTLGDGTALGTADFDSTPGTLKLINMVPGDYVEFDITITNESNVAAAYRTIVTTTDGDGLLPALKFELTYPNPADPDDDPHTETFTGANTIVSASNDLPVSTTPITVHVIVSMPEDVGNEYQNKTCSLKFIVEAVQGNAQLNLEADEVKLYTVGDLFAFAQAVNSGNKFEGKTVKLMNDIDLAGYVWTPAGKVGYYPTYQFAGTFDGQGNTIKNMVARDFTAHGENAMASAGFFGAITGKVQNLNFDNAKVESSHYAGVVCGYSSANVGMEIVNCHVTNSTVASYPEKVGANWDNGDKVGGIIGFAVGGDKIANCSVSNITLTAYRDIGGILGRMGGAVVMNDNEAENVTVYIDNAHNYKAFVNMAAHNYGNIYGGDTEAPASVNYCAIVTNAAELADLKNLAASVDTVILAKDIDMTGVAYDAWTLTLGAGKTFTLDGNGHTISNLTVNGYVNGADFQSAGLFARVESASHTPASNIGTLKVQDLTLANANVEQNNGSQAAAAALVGCASVANVDIDNCKVINSTITSAKYAGAFIGYAQQYYTEVETTIDNSVVEGCTITANGHAAGMVGFSNEVVKITDGSVKNNTVDGQGGHSAAALVGTGEWVASGDVTVSGNTYRGGGKCGDTVDVSDPVYGISHIG